jgi:hypothetical protein
MHVDQTRPADPVSETDAALLAFVAGRSVPCPRCAHDLRDLRSAHCPECGEPLILKVGTPRARFGWLLVALAPGCFSGLAAVFVLVPVSVALYQGLALGRSIPWPVVLVDLFGFASAATVWLMYRERHRLMARSVRRQVVFASAVWGGHVLALLIFLFSVWYWR